MLAKPTQVSYDLSDRDITGFGGVSGVHLLGALSWHAPVSERDGVLAAASAQGSRLGAVVEADRVARMRPNGVESQTSFCVELRYPH